jgi:N-methylhydantoinase A
VAIAQRAPVSTIGSGPAGGLAGTLAIARASGHPNVIATDMGGTSFEVGLVIGGQAVLAGQQVVGQYSFHLPHLDLRSIACGGGSIARVDPHSGALRVGPESAGATPGPACYGRGTEPTVTDADIVLGLVDPDRFLGGRMPLDRAAAERAVGLLARQLGLSLEETAAGIVHINSHSAATLIRQRTVEQGLDPREFVVYAFGGAGPVHAFGFAEELGVGEVVIPLGNGASLLSAYGIAASDVVRSFERECRVAAPFDPAELTRVVEELEAEAVQAMEAAGFDRSHMELERMGMLRYAEQYLQELPLVLPSGPIDEQAATDLSGRFDAEYVRLYGEGARAVFQAVEMFAVRVAVRIPLGFATTTASPGARPGATEIVAADTRPVYWPQEHGWVPTAVHDGLELTAQTTVVGPAVIELPHTTVAVATGQRLAPDAIGNLVLTVA